MELDEIFKRQVELNERILPTLYKDIKEDSVIKREWFLKFERALSQELAEAVDSVNWKWWKKQEDNWNNAKIELIDILHFWVSMCTVAGLSAKDVIDLYNKKNDLNHKRQDNGYQTGEYKKTIDGVEDNELLHDK